MEPEFRDNAGEDHDEDADYDGWLAAKREEERKATQAIERRWPVVRIGFFVLALYLLITSLIACFH